MPITQLTRLLNTLITPHSRNKDLARRERILHILLLTSIFLSTSAVIKVTLTTLRTLYSDSTYRPVPPTFFLVLIGIFSLGLYASKKGYSKIISLLFIGVGVIVSASSSWSWGPDLPQPLLTYALLIVMSGILISSTFSFILTGLIFLFLYTLTYLHVHGLHEIEYFWREETPGLSDAIMFGVTLTAVALISWLFNRESENALHRARLSEKALRHQRNQLEKKVIEQTQELRKIHAEKIRELYRFAELGSRVSVLLHDLATPLNVISLNLAELQEQSKKIQSDEIHEMKEAIKLAHLSTQKIEEYLELNRSSLQNREVKQRFSLSEKVNVCIKMLQKRAHKLGVDIQLHASKKVHLYGNPTKFYQLLTNLLTNALDAYEKNKEISHKQRIIRIDIRETDDQVMLIVKDRAGGIEPAIQKVMFTQFYTTQEKSEHLGLGLSICKEIVENDFGGTIVCTSQLAKGSTFTITLPLR